MGSVFEYAGLVDALLVVGVGMLLAETLVCLAHLLVFDA
jgi:hypothetical protein